MSVAQLIVVPAAPVLLPGHSRVPPPDLAQVLAACDRALGPAVSGVRDVHIVAAPDQLRDRSRARGTGRSTAAAVADALLDRVGFTGVRIPARPTGDVGGVWMFLADGSATVGEKSPRAGAPGQQFDDRVEGALRSGDLAALADVDDTAAAAVGCVTAEVWRQLARFGAAECQELDAFAPFGVRYFVGRLRVA